MAWASITNYISIDILIIYLSAIFWTLGYDTIYGVQDIVDDEIIGVKSTSIKFKSMLKKFVLICYLANSILLLSFFMIYLPKSLRLGIGTLVGSSIKYFNTKRSGIVKTNLSLCFKSMDKNKLNSIHDAYFKNLGKTIIDIPTLWWKSNKSLQDNCEIINSHYIDDELSKGKGVILLTPHTVSLDFGGRSISRYPIISMYKPFRNKLLNWFIGKSRSKNTDNVIVYPRENFSFKKVITALKKPIVFYYIADEDLGSKNSEFADFYDEKKSTLISISKIASLFCPFNII